MFKSSVSMFLLESAKKAGHGLLESVPLLSRSLVTPVTYIYVI